MFNKTLTQVQSDDIHWILDQEIQEGLTVEFKETLPAKGGGVDPWMEDGKRVGDKARNKILQEVIAFANADGGTLFLGIRETSTKPARGASLALLPKCAELAERFRHFCRDGIEPQVPNLETVGLSMDADASGVVIIRVPKSRSAPHRHRFDRECYVRREDRTEKMSMREIQDLVLLVDRGLAAVEKRFENRSEMFESAFREFMHAHGPSGFALRATAIPVAEFNLSRVHDRSEFTPTSHKFPATIGDKGQFELFFPTVGSTWKPILRGSRRTGDMQRNYSVVIEVTCDGTVEFSLFSRPKEDDPLILYPEWFAGMVCNSLASLEKFRRAGGAPDTEYGLEIEVTILSHTVQVGRYGSSIENHLGPFPQGKTPFPRYSVGPQSDFGLILSAIERDFWNAAGHDFQESFVVDFREALTHLGIYH